MAASTSTQLGEPFNWSSSLPPRKYDVFLSFRGEDTRLNFTDHLYSTLVREGFCTFRDDDKLERGEDIAIELLKAIEESKISIVVFSKDYAASRWCLDELVKILECRSTCQQTVIPVFYNVDPSDVRGQKGSFAEAFAKHEVRFQGKEDKLERWKKALTEAANLSGWDLQNVANGHESKFVDKIVEDISIKLNLAYSYVAMYPVGLESRIHYINSLLSTGLDDIRMVGIWGIGGLGKTTIAKAIYNQLKLKFEGSSFLANVKEISRQPNGLVGLQEQLCSDILKREGINIRNVDQGIEVIRHRLWCRKVLLVIDDVDDIAQLKAFAIRRDWLRFGSRIIITSRDEFLLNWLKVDERYMPEPLNDYESLQLFSWHAFGKDHPVEDYAELSQQVVSYSGGLPLALEVLGSFLSDKSMLEWNSALQKLKVIPHDAIQEKLKISFDSLNDEQKNLFLDIVCFFVGMKKNYIISILEGCGFFPEIEIGVLFRRCLVKYGDISQQRLTIHDMLRDMGREIVRKECPNEPGKRSRLWFHKEAFDVLTSHTGTETVEGLVLNMPQSNNVQVNAQAFAKMNRLRLLKLNYLQLSGSYEIFSKRLVLLCWHGFPLKSIPSNFSMENVVEIDMSYSNLKKVWKGTKILNKLKFLNLSHSYHLTETPDFLGLTSLRVLVLNNCTRLVKVDQSIECLDKLVLFDLENCKNLRKLPQGIFKLKSLQDFNVSGCPAVEKQPGLKVPLSNLWFSLFSSRASPMRNPDSIRLSPASIGGLTSIKRLSLADCNLSYVPDEIGSLTSLKNLCLSGNNFCNLPTSISHLSQLQFLFLNKCPKLESVGELPVNLQAVCANNCTSLERISIRSNFRGSPLMEFHGCQKLVQNNVASNFRDRLLQCQELSSLCDFQFFLPGFEVPDCFYYQTAGPILSFVVPPLPDQKIQGLALCVVYECPKDEYIQFSYDVINKTKGLRHNSDSHSSRARDQHLMWLQYVPQGPGWPKNICMEAGDEVEFLIDEVACISAFKVKKCGISLIYEDGEEKFLPKSNDQATFENASPSYPDIIFDKDKDISTDVVTENRVVRHSYLRVLLSLSFCLSFVFVVVFFMLSYM